MLLNMQNLSVIITAVDFTIANALAKLWKEFPVAKRQSATAARFSTGIGFLKFVSCLFKFICTSDTKFSKFKPLMRESCRHLF